MLSFLRLLLVSLASSTAVLAAVLANSGEATYYNTGLGACGRTNNDNELVVAVSAQFYDTYPGATANPNLNPVCGRRVTAQYQGKTVTVTVVDRCPGCGKFDLDLSPEAFKKLAALSVGRIHGVVWTIS